MSFADEFRNDFNGIFGYGEKVRFKYFSLSGGSASYDDDVVLTQSGVDFWTSGIIQPVSSNKGFLEHQLVSQGKLLSDDSKLYVQGSVDTSGLFKVGFGSPIRQEYGLTDAGIVGWQVNGSVIYKKLFVRVLTNGSILGE